MIIPSPAGMALPVVKTLADCADYSKTVAPYVDQLYTLPSLLLQTKSLDGLKEIYVATNPLITAFAFSLVFAQVVFIVSEANKNYSQVDRCWSILPTIYNAHYWLWAHANGLGSQKLDAVLTFSCIWSVRLTFNYWRKGGYQIGSEDYRWEIVKKRIPGPVWVAFNVVFISLIQSVLLLAVTTPTYILLLVSRVKGPTWTFEDQLFSAILVGLVVIEFFSDNQQWYFHEAKNTYQKTAKVPPGWEQRDLDRGFNTSGLWRYSRHPNFAAEQAVWVSLYQWACFETGTLMNWTFVGALSYLFLFQGSTWLTERITSGKYPEYKAYQERVGMFVPSVLGGNWDAYVAEQAQKNDGKKSK